MQIAGNVFVVTGGGDGIGREVVLGLLAKGASVAALDLRAEALEKTAALAQAGPRLSTHVVDVSHRDAVDALPDAIIGIHGHIDGLINVAGIIHRFAPFPELTREEIDKVFAVNVWGVINTCTAFLPLLTKRPQACLINVSSMGGLTPFPGQTAYGASKAAVKLLTEGLATENVGTHLRVSAVFPGGVTTHIATNSGAMEPSHDRAADYQKYLTTPRHAAERIITDGVEKGHFRVVIGKDAHALDALSRVLPRATATMVARALKKAGM